MAVISGRAGAEVQRLVGVPGIESVGSHGLELAPEAAAWRDRLMDFVAGVDWPVEDKGVTVSFHYRTTADQERARRVLERVAEDARAAGLDARWGRKVLELRPPLDADKGTAVRHLLAGRGLQRALYVGDDTTDVDAFDAVHELELGVAIGVRSAEMPEMLGRSADLLVDGTEGVLTLMRRL